MDQAVPHLESHQLIIENLGEQLLTRSVVGEAIDRSFSHDRVHRFLIDVVHDVYDLSPYKADRREVFLSWRGWSWRLQGATQMSSKFCLLAEDVN